MGLLSGTEIVWKLSLILLTFATLVPIPEQQRETLTPPSGDVNLAPALVSTDFPWTMFHGEPSHKGFTLATVPVANSLVWTTVTGGPVSSPIVADGLVYVGSSDTILYALNESSGGMVWTWKTSGAITASPAFYGGLVFVASQDQTLYALIARTGQLRWSSIQLAPLSSSPAVADGLVFFGTQYSGSARTARIMALNVTYGSTFWTYDWPASILSSPTVDQGMVFVGTSNGYVLALNKTTGGEVWRYQAGTSQVSTPAVSSNYVYATTSSNRAVALDRLTGALRWSRGLGGAANPSPSSPALAEGKLVFGTGRGTIVALNATTGSTLWTVTTGGPVTSSPAIGVDTLVVGSNDGRTYALALTTGGLKWTLATGGPVESSPAVADKIVFVGSQDGRVYAIGSPPPVLEVSIVASQLLVNTGMKARVMIYVTTNSLPMDPAGLSLAASFGSPSLTVHEGPGVYSAEYSAPLVLALTLVNLEAVASEPGYVSGTGLVVLTVKPPSLLTAYAVLSSPRAGPGSTVEILIQLLNDTAPVTGAEVVAQSTFGGSFSPPVDLGNGNYTVVYSAPNQDFPEPTAGLILVSASKPGFTGAFITAQLVVFGSRIPPSVIPEFPFVWIAILGVGIGGAGFGAYWFKFREREKPRTLERGLEFDQALLKAVDSAYELVGPNVWENIMNDILFQYKLRREDIPSNIEMLEQGWAEALGYGAPMVEKYILRRLHQELCVDYVPGEGNFSTVIRNLQAYCVNTKRKRDIDN